jgi:PAS domain S-box-containing protein
MAQPQVLTQSHVSARKKLHDKKSHFENLVALVEDYGIFTMDCEGNILDWNLGAERMKGYSPDEIIGRNFSTFFTDEDKATGHPARELEIAAEQGRFAEEGWRICKDGSQIWASVNITAIRGDDGGVIGFLKITRDLTELMRATESLRQSEERFRLLLENIHDYAIFMLDPEGHIISWNSGARRIKGYEPEEIIGRHFSTFYPPEALALGTPQTLLRQALRNGSAEHEGWRMRKDGSLFWGHVVLTALYDSKRELRGFTKITRDLTDRREFQELQESGRLKDVFLATLAHELRNPLAPMLPALELISKAAGDSEIIKRLSGMMSRQVDQLSFLIDELLDMSRLTSGKITLKKSRGCLADVVATAVDSVQPAADKRGHDFKVILPEGNVEIEADTHRVSQIITNLLSNAIRYTPPGGVIRLEVSIEAFPMLRLSVRDNGKGIPRSLHQQIFDLFNQGVNGSDEGLGIGLTVVKYLVEMHGGNITVNSEEDGKGSEFIVSLPILVAEANEETREIGRQDSGARRCRKVLVADDGRNAADILALFFQMEGMETAVAYDGDEAVEIAKSFQPDLILMDLGMPVMSGYEAARVMRNHLKNVVLVALSGWGADDDRRRSSDAGFDLHLLKPVAPADLRNLITQHFQSLS